MLIYGVYNLVGVRYVGIVFLVDGGVFFEVVIGVIVVNIVYFFLVIVFFCFG